jgi:uncharacterized protein (DUF58 family)
MSLDPQLLSAIADLELIARVVVEGTIAGLHRSPFHGYSAEFHQYRHYRQGDDLKYIDWKLYGRTDRLYTKQYRETTNMVAQIAIDASGSMAYAGRVGASKIVYARLIAAALAHLVSRQGDAVGTVGYGDSVRHYIPSRGGASHLRGLLIALANLEAGGETAAAAALGRAVDLLRRRGLLVVLSDLYDEEEAVARELTRAVRMGHEVAVFQVLTPDEIEFPFTGDVEFEDVETGRSVVASPRAHAAQYRTDMAAFVQRWRSRCASLGIDFTVARTDMPLDAVLRGYLLRRRRGDRGR